MKKFYLAIVTLLVAVCSVSAQTTLIATLSHEGNLEMFYGSSALKEAYNASNGGDVITLSAGSFDAVDIEKAITIRGAGMGLDDGSKYTIPTILNGDFHIYNQEKISLEGLYINRIRISSAADLIKCWIKAVSYDVPYQYVNYHGDINCINCVIENSPSLPSYRDYVFLNCIMLNMYPSTNPQAKGVFTNCFIEFLNSNTYSLAICGQTFTNCIICTSEQSRSYITLNENLYAYSYYCLFYNQKGTASFNSTPNGTNVERLDLDTPFTAEGFYNLKDEFKNFTTSDGTELGIYGGNMSFSQTPNAPQITKFAVAPKTSADGKLSIELEVQVAE